MTWFKLVTRKENVVKYSPFLKEKVDKYSPLFFEIFQEVSIIC